MKVQSVEVLVSLQPLLLPHFHYLRLYALRREGLPHKVPRVVACTLLLLYHREIVARKGLFGLVFSLLAPVLLEVPSLVLSNCCYQPFPLSPYQTLFSIRKRESNVLVLYPSNALKVLKSRLITVRLVKNVSFILVSTITKNYWLFNGISSKRLAPLTYNSTNKLVHILRAVFLNV